MPRAKTANLAEKVWDTHYGKPATPQRPIPFTKTIMGMVDSEFRTGRGLYVGCGNGRNYIPLVRHGLDIDGLDISGTGLEYIRGKIPGCTLLHKDMLEYSARPYDYLISIQVFQHGNLDTAKRYIEKSHALLKKDGLLFLRVNSASTKIFYGHKTIGGDMGRTILYTQGPKDGLVVHFFTKEGILELLGPYFELQGQISERKMRRAPPKSGFWAQLELVLRRKPRRTGRP